MRSTTIGVVIPIQLLDWLDLKAKANGMTRSRMVAQMLLEESGLDTARKQATREIADVTGQIPIGTPNLGW